MISSPLMDDRRGRLFDFFVAISQFWGVCLVVLSGYYHGGFGPGLQWKEQGRGNFGNMNYHGVLMTYGFVFLQGEALLAFRLFRHETKIFSKVLHFFTHMLALAVIGTGIGAIVNSKNIGAQKHMYTFHSWIGVGLVACYGSQFIMGFVNFVFPRTSNMIRAAFMPFHRAFGAAIFGVSAAQVMSGEMEFFRIKAPNQPCFETLLCPRREGIILNMTMVALVFYTASVLYLVLRSDYRREKTPEEME